MGRPVHDCMKKRTPFPFFFCSAHIELTNHVATSLHSLVTNFPSLWFYVSHLSPLPHSISHIILHLSPKAGRVPIGAAAAQNSLNDLIVIQSISLQQRNLSVLDRNQYGLVTVNSFKLSDTIGAHLHASKK